ncbi:MULTISPECIES: MauE/DoxX family redox-associated membrane protein [unclassified Nonomuraea]|uniref:MauE/DoxX family redox-associated membrane protein n=1 Tax=Nonomuraea sp. NPDC003804 TaxID=3154547 RepID=UPI0033B8EC7D
MLYLMIACRALLAAVFTIALVGKIRGRAAFDEFAASIVALGILPRGGSAVAAHALVAAEAVVVLLLALPPAVPLGFAAAVGALTVLTGGILAALRRGRQAPCRCFGASATPLGRVHVVRNLVLAALGGVGLTAWITAGTSAPHPAGVVLALVAAGVGALLVVRLDDLMELFTV